MSTKHPPLDLLVRMGRGQLNVITSMACLAAALAVQRKDFSPPEITTSGEPLPPAFKRSILEAVERVRQDFLTARPDELQAAIDLYVAHLKFCGFTAEWGRTN